MRSVFLLIFLWTACQSVSLGQGNADGAGGSPTGDSDGRPKNGLIPSREAFNRDDTELPIDAFLFLSESGSQVVVPGTTWEQLEKLKRLEGGAQTDSGRFVYQSLKIIGTTDEGRAELEVTFQITIEPTEGRFVKIPLGMSNFHLLASPSISGVSEQAIVVAENNAGYQWWVRTDKACRAKLEMKVSARVETMPADSVSFKLPNIPSTVTLRVDAEDVRGEVISNAEEVVTSTPVAEKKTQLLVESNGGDFLLGWTGRRNVAQQKPLLEVESRIDVRWDSPQDQPIASVRLTARNAKGVIDRFQIRLPTGSALLDVPRLGTGGQAIQFVPVKTGDNQSAPSAGDLVEVVLPLEEQQQRIDLNFELQLSGGEISAESPLVMTVPRVVDSLRHRGEMSVRLSEDYRLRWETKPWVRSEPVDEIDQDADGRIYRFRFDRGSFELPIWLSTDERKVTLAVQSEVIIRDATASLQMQIKVGGSVVNNMLRLDDASWDVTSIVDEDTGRSVETFLIGEERVIQWGQPSRQDDLVFLLTAQRRLGQDLGDIKFPLPTITTSENEIVAGQSNLNLVSNGRTLMIVDLAESAGLTRISTSKSDSSTGATLSRFQIARFGEPVVVVGTLQNQPLRLTLTPEATVEIDGSQLASTVDWLIESPLDLEGRLPIRIPSRKGDQLSKANSLLDPDAIGGLLPKIFGQQPTEATPDAFDKASSEEDLVDQASIFGRVSKSVLDQWDSPEGAWVVTVDGVPATLRKFEDDRFELVSERLASGTMSIRWRHWQGIASSSVGQKLQEVVFPRPYIADVTMRGNFKIYLQGDDNSQLVSVESTASKEDAGKFTPDKRRLSETQFLSSTDQGTTLGDRFLILDTLPREPVSLRLKKQTADVQELIVQQLVLRTVTGYRTRQEQVLATIERGSEFRVFLPQFAKFSGKEDLAQLLSVEAIVDSQRVRVEIRQGWLSVDLPGDQEPHSLELNIWIPQNSSSFFSKVKPLVELPRGLGRVFWQVISPLDSHVVWASPSVGRAMSWQFDQWRLYRQSSLNDQELARLFGGAIAAMPPGNRYLYVGTDLPAFEATIASRTVLWMIVASTVLLVTVFLTYIPATRNPVTAVIAALFFAGLILIAPDAAVIAGQFGLISLVLVIVMLAIRSLLVPGRHDRVFATTSKSSIGTSSTRILGGGMSESSPSSIPQRGGFSETESMSPPRLQQPDVTKPDVAQADVAQADVAQADAKQATDLPPDSSASGAEIAS